MFLYGRSTFEFNFKVVTVVLNSFRRTRVKDVGVLSDTL